MESRYKGQMWCWIIFWIMLFLTIIVVNICIAWVNTPTDWSIQIMMDNNTKEVFYFLNESGSFQ